VSFNNVIPGWMAKKMATDEECGASKDFSRMPMCSGQPKPHMVYCRAFRGHTGQHTVTEHGVTHRWPGMGVRGEDNHQHKLTEEDVRTIRRRLHRGDLQEAIAADYGVCRMTVSRIKTGRTWRTLV